MAEKTHQAGETVSTSGIYLARHNGHRSEHEVLALEGTRFPRCRTCGDRVQFQLVRPASPIGDDGDFAHRDA